MSDDIFSRSINITMKLIESIGEKDLQAACDKLSSSCRHEPERNREPISADEEKENAIQHTQSDSISSDVQSVYDMKYAWHIASSTACELSVYSILLLYVGVGLFKKQYPDFLGNELVYVSILAVIIQFFVIFFSVWRAHHPAVIFEMGKIGTLNFCAQDVENSVLDYMLFRKTRNSWKRRTLLVSDIYRVDNEVFQTRGKNKVKFYSINISGKFGSQKIVFSNKQKRDECRALFSVAIKKYAKDARMDSNLSVGSSGDSGY